MSSAEDIEEKSDIHEETLLSRGDTDGHNDEESSLSASSDSTTVIAIGNQTAKPRHDGKIVDRSEGLLDQISDDKSKSSASSKHSEVLQDQLCDDTSKLSASCDHSEIIGDQLCDDKSKSSASSEHSEVLQDQLCDDTSKLSASCDHSEIIGDQLCDDESKSSAISEHSEVLRDQLCDDTSKLSASCDRSEIIGDQLCDDESKASISSEYSQVLQDQLCDDDSNSSTKFDHPELVEDELSYDKSKTSSSKRSEVLQYQLNDDESKSSSSFHCSQVICDNKSETRKIILDQPCEDKSKSSASSDQDDDNMVLKWDDDDIDETSPDTKELSLDPDEIDEDELLKDIEDKIMELNKNEDEIYENTSKTLTIDKQSLRDPNAMLEIPSQEIIEFSDDEEMIENWKMPDDLDEDIKNDGISLNTNDENTATTSKDTTNITNSNKINSISNILETVNRESESSPIENENEGTNLGDLILESLNDEEKLLDKEPLNVIPFTVDSEPETDEIIEVDDCIDLEDEPEEKKFISEEEELINAISGMKESMQDLDVTTNFIEDIDEMKEHDIVDENLLQDSMAIDTDAGPTLIDSEQSSDMEPAIMNSEQIYNEEPAMMNSKQISDEEPALMNTKQIVKEEGTVMNSNQIVKEEPTVINSKQIDKEETTVMNSKQIVKEEPTVMNSNQIVKEETTLINTKQIGDEEHAACEQQSSESIESQKEQINIGMTDLSEKCVEDSEVKSELLTENKEMEEKIGEAIAKAEEMDVETVESHILSTATPVQEALVINESTIDEDIKGISNDEKLSSLHVIKSEHLSNVSPAMDLERNSNLLQEANKNEKTKLSISLTTEIMLPNDKVIETTEQVTKSSSYVEECLPSTSKADQNEAINSEKEMETNLEETNNSYGKECLPSTSKIDDNMQSEMDSTQDNVQDTSDSLGLLAESSRVMDDDEDGDDDDDGDDEDDFDPDDESSNQMVADQSEDSNTRFEGDLQKEVKDANEGDYKTLHTFEFSKETEESVEQTQEIDKNDRVDVNQEDNAKMDDSVKATADIETLKLSDTDTDDGDNKANTESKTDGKSSKLEKVTSFVDLEESSSEDDVQELPNPNVTSVNLPAEIEVMASICSTSTGNTDIVTRQGEVVISGIPKPPPAKPTRLNTSEVTIKTTKAPSLEVFNLDSDEDELTELENPDVPLETESVAEDVPKRTRKKKCVNESCPNDSTLYSVADNSTVSFYDGKKNRHYVCDTCANVVAVRNAKLIEGIRNFEDLLSLDLGKDCKDPIEVLDSDSDEEVDPEDVENEVIGESEAKSLEEKLADMINETWEKFKMETRLLDTVDDLKVQMADLEREGQQVDEMLKECQMSTDKLRNELYATFQPEIKELASLCIFDTPHQPFSATEIKANQPETRQLKRRLSPTNESSSKRAAIPLGYTPLNAETAQPPNEDSPNLEKIEDDNTDIAVVKLSAEVAPADLPPPGTLVRAPLRPGMSVYAKRTDLRSWGKAVVIEVGGATSSEYSNCRVKFETGPKTIIKSLTGQCIAYFHEANARMTIGTRVIALYQDTNLKVKNQKQSEAFYAGVVAEVPNPVNNYRYLIFFDHGYAQYAKHSNTRLVCECSSLVWEEVDSVSKDFIKKYLLEYPERPMVRLHAGQTIKTEWKGRWCKSKVLKVDASLVLVQFGKEAQERLEWFYRGSNRLAPLFLEQQAAERQRPRALPRAQAHSRTNTPYVEYTRSDEQTNKSHETQQKELNSEEVRRQRSVAKKSTTQAPQSLPTVSPKLENFTSRVVYYTPKNAVRPYRILGPHTCGAGCRRRDVLPLRDLRTYNPLAKPLLSGWERQLVRWKGSKDVMYRAPCGRRLRNMKELHRYLRLVGSDMGVDLFDFNPNTHCLAEFVINKCLISKKDLSHGKENVPVPCVNYYDEALPEFCSYNTERTPTAGVPLNLDPEFLCGCDCEDDCEDKTKCACWKMTLEGARTIGLKGANVGYVYKRLPEPLPSGIYECNSRCKCKSTCLNRVAQHPLQLKLQVFKTLNRGWGIRALNDVPKGAFLCIYAGNLLTDATANLDGLNEGDEYLAELDYIEVVEQMKEGFEEDIPASIKQLDKKESETTPDESETEQESSSEEERNPKKDGDAEFLPGYIGPGPTSFNKRLRKRNKMVQEMPKVQDTKQSENEPEREKKTGDDCITISDDEDVREPSRFTAAAGMGGKEFLSKYKSVRTLFGEDEACYIMDAKVQGNIGRYLNHSCCPNVFVQNVFVDTHDPRFPWVAFFALAHIRAGKELTWNYNYDVGSVPDKVLYCHCGEPNCRGRLL